jgi:hypothetical protein
MLDLHDIEIEDVNELMALGISPRAIVHPDPPMTCRGVVLNGVFEQTKTGPKWFAFAGLSDIILWQPKTGQLVSEWNSAFALGEQLIDNPGATFDGWLRIHGDPLEWLLNDRAGIVILRWAWAYEWLRDLPGVAVAQRLLPVYRRAMKAPMPKLAVIPSHPEKAVA